MKDFEKMGVFYLGRDHDLDSGALKDDHVLLKSKDLTTHAAIIGMTGSGKTGLGIGLIEEAAMDQIPVIAIDPKGDLGNIALTFPELDPKDFRPWINLQEAANKSMSPEEYAEAQAKMWKEGLAQWDQDGQRIRQMRDKVEINVYTPGGSYGKGVSAIKSFDSPPLALKNDLDAYRDKVQGTVIGLLTLLGIDSDQLIGRENILLSNILENAWNDDRNLSIADLIGEIQKPPMDTIGVMDLESFYPAKERFELAMKINNILASPGFKAWIEGEPLNIENFLYNKSGKPKVSIFSIAHLTDSERMFFVTMLLNEILAWVRTQSGTGSLRAILYMDELFGFLPPTANPPSKTPLLTLLKQARAFGLGLVLSTQNPVDLDYKALSNIGTWFIGRLQTERDKARVLDGLEGAAVGGSFDKKRTEQILAGLGKRIFYLHSVHEDEPRIFQTRWVMSYLAGPLTGEQIRNLPVDFSEEIDKIEAGKIVTENIKSTLDPSESQPALDPVIKQFFYSRNNTGGDLYYEPWILGIADIAYASAKYSVSASKKIIMAAPLTDGPIPLDWNKGKKLDLDLSDLSSDGEKGASFGKLPGVGADPKSYEKWKKLFVTHVRNNESLKLMSNPILKVVSEPFEDERDFSIRIQHMVHEKRDEEMETLRKKYASKFNTLQTRLLRAEQALEKKTQQASQKKMDAAVTAGSAILGALFGKRSISATSLSKVGSAMKSTGRAFKSGEDIDRARETLESVKNQIEDLERELENELDSITQMYDDAINEFEEIEVKATSNNVTVHALALGWIERNSF
ncbi:ATP-binding protein [Alkalibacter mobilis]|uniref:ATP-binding protein n=1 Tax=Alkalibacter mobilis TaxID=2787712 RepID=UPI0018A12510|nr:DUF87 domain-containing protein [Alkalibacter mobilis]MBF7096240.1 DUF87 domain-containing protein [Alkalibacter mobilis]